MLMSGGVEASLVSLQEQSVKFSFSVTAGFGFDGNHLETEGLDVGGNSVTVPLHQHRVTVNMLNIQPTLTTAALADWNLEIRLPLRIIDRSAKIVPEEGMTSEEFADAQRHLDIHHPNETLQGIGDASLMFRPRNADNPWSWGATLPTGKTEEDPYVLGEQNLAHEHIQFGTGTVVPRLEYRLLDESWATRLSLKAPIYANHHGFTAPPELDLFVARRGMLVTDLHWTLGASVRAQGYADWSGTRDINTGYGVLVADAGLSWNTESGVFNFGVTVPLAQRIWQDGSDAFELGTSVAFSFSP